MKLGAAKASVHKKRLTISFMYWRNDEAPIKDRIYSFGTPRDPSKNFKPKHLAEIQEGQEG